MQPSNNSIQSQLLKAQFPTHLYSPRTSYSNYLKQIQQLKTNMIINIDKYILGNLKTQFEKRNKQLTFVQFMYFAKKFLKEWNLQLEGRDVKMQECLNQLWEQIDRENRGKIVWEEFNSKIIETSLNLKSLANNAGIQAPTFSEFGVPVNPSKYQSPISKIIYVNKKHKMAFFREQSTQIYFFSTESSLSNSIDTSQTKPIFLPQQQLKVQTMIKVKQKSQHQTMQKSTKGLSKMIKKDVKVSSYKNTVLNAIYLSDSKYDMLIVSCSDKHIRGYDVENLVPIIACQPQNEDQPMIHQFPVQIYNLAWDEINEVLYATGKGTTIYQWMVKTDSQREIIDSRGHDGMVSAIFMMPKLQLLATGGFDGKLLLWDTVGQVVKMKYQQHNRAISAITFHEGLVLLFTSALDHKICVWNPYIGSLIHKIDSSLNIVQLQIIPNTSYLISVDNGGNVKVRQINRFTQIANFSIFRSQNADQTQKLITNIKSTNSQKQKQINITMCSKKDNPILYYFGTDKIIGYRFNEIQKTSLIINSGTIVEMKYSSKHMKLYTPIKNHIIIWNLLTGLNEETFYDMMENDITAFQLVQELGFFIVGDTDGNVLQRRSVNGSLISKLPKMKAPLKNIKFYQLQRNQPQKNPYLTSRKYHLFCTTQQGDISIHKCSPKGQFEPHRQFSLRNDFSLVNTNISTIDYYSQKNIIVIALTSNEIVCIDVEKRSLLVKISLADHLFLNMNVVQSPQKNFYLLINSKYGQLMPFYLPPHNKKFKNCPLITTQTVGQIQCSIYGPKTQKYFMSSQKHQLLAFDFDTKFLDSQQSQQLPIKWKKKLQQRIVEMILIQNQEILILLNQSEDFTFISTQNGTVICHLSLEDIKNQFMNKSPIQPIMYFKSKTNQILLPAPKQKIIKIEDHQTDLKQKIMKTIDPYYYLNKLEQKSIDNFNKVSNPSWKLNFNIPHFVEKRINKIESIEDKITNFLKNSQSNGLSHKGNRIQKALQLQKKWQKEKDNQQQRQEIQNQEVIMRKVNSMERKSTSKYDIKAFDKMMKKVQRGSSLSSLWKQGQKPKKLSQFSVHTQSNAKDNFDGSKIKKFSHIEQIDFSKLQKDPLYRLGLALKNVNTKDRQAQNFIELAKKKQQVKLPKISSQKIKL